MSAGPDRKTLIVVSGPTASGKTALAIELARHFSTEIISADSRQIYRDIPIGTAAPSAAELAMVRHHLIGTLPLDAYYSAAMFEQDALRLLDDIFSRADYAVVCGGSMMYVDALTRGIDDMPTVSPEVRQRVRDLYETHGAEGLAALLEITDPDYWARVDRANTRRVMHALEISMQAGVPYSTLLTGERRERPFRTVKMMIGHTREALFDRINRRTDAMIAGGLIDEARALLPMRHLNSLNTVGYKEMFACFDGLMDLPTATARIAKNTRVYAKKQLTWLRRDPDIITLDPSNPFPAALEAINKM